MIQYYKFTLFIFLISVSLMTARAYDFEVDGIFYNIIEDNKVEVTYSNEILYEGLIEIPALVEYENLDYEVISIGYSAFFGCAQLTEIIIPFSIETIRTDAFRLCPSLRNINVNINNPRYASIDGILYSKSISRLILCPGGKENVYIPDSVDTIEQWAFYGCSSLKNINVDVNNTSFSSIEGVLYNKRGTCLIQCPSCKEKVIIPNTVIIIEDFAFYECNSLKEIIIPNSVTSIGYESFNACVSLTDVVIPYSVSSIGDYAFANCLSLTEITLSKSVQSIGKYAFGNCSSLKEIKVSSDNQAYTSIDGVLYDKNITTLIQCPGGKNQVLIPDSITSIGLGAFYGCIYISKVSIPNSVTSIAQDAFAYCISLDTIILPETLSSIGIVAFEGCQSLIKISIPESVTSIGYGTFQGCTSLTDIDFPSSLSSIGEYAFENCLSLKEITLPSSLKSIDECAFMNCALLKKINCLAETIPNLGIQCFSNISQDAILYVIDNLVLFYRYSDWAQYFSDILPIDSGKEETFPLIKVIDDIEYTLFEDLTAQVNHLEGDLWNQAMGIEATYCTVNIPDYVSYKEKDFTVTHIGEHAFEMCGNITDIVLPNTLVEVGKYAFYGCSSLSSIDIPESVKTIDESAFRWCTSLKSALIPNSVTFIGELAFLNCESLVEVFIPSTVKIIGEDPFGSCESLQFINVDNLNPNYSSVDGILFNKDQTLLIQCPGAKDQYEIPATVTEIANYAFEDCYKLFSLQIPSSVTNIGYETFIGCSSLDQIYCFSLNPPKCGNSCFSQVPVSTTTLYVPEESVQLYSVTFPWSEFGMICSVSDAGVESLILDSDLRISIYSPSGILIKRDSEFEDIKSLPKGIYIVVSGKDRYKISI